MTELAQYTQCDVKLNVSGPSQKTVTNWTAAALHRIADQLERDEFEGGHHEVGDNSGRPIGTVYFDFTEGFHFEED